MEPNQVDTTINLGHIISLSGSVIAIAIAALGSFYALKGRLIRIETTNKIQSGSIDAIQSEVKELKNVLITMGRFDERLIAMQKEVTELRHGIGFIKANGVK
jgi:hypothetical protein